MKTRRFPYFWQGLVYFCRCFVLILSSWSADIGKIMNDDSRAGKDFFSSFRVFLISILLSYSIPFCIPAAMFVETKVIYTQKILVQNGKRLT